MVLLSAAAALSFAIALAALRGGRLSAAERLPFGTFLAPAIWVVWGLGAWARGL